MSAIAYDLPFHGRILKQILTILQKKKVKRNFVGSRSMPYGWKTCEGKQHSTDANRNLKNTTDRTHFDPQTKFAHKIENLNLPDNRTTVSFPTFSFSFFFPPRVLSLCGTTVPDAQFCTRYVANDTAILRFRAMYNDLECKMFKKLIRDFICFSLKVHKPQKTLNVTTAILFLFSYNAISVTAFSFFLLGH